MGRPKLKIKMEEATAARVDYLYRHTKDVREKERLLAVRLARQGQHTFAEIAEEVGRSRSVIQQWLGLLAEGGLAQLLVRKQAPGKASPLREGNLKEAIQAGLRRGQWRTAGQMQQWLEQEHGIKRSLSTMYYWLGKVAGVLKVPRPVHLKKNEALTPVFLESLENRLEALNLPGPIKLWVVDESRYGLHSVQRRCWGLRGHRVVLPAQQDYQWGYVYGALEMGTGAAEFLYTPTVNLEWSDAFLAQLKASAPEASHVVIWDQAGFHAKQAQLQGVHLLSLPPYSPELNPIEQLWDIVQDLICNRIFASLDQLEEALSAALRPYWSTAAKVHSLLGLHPLVVRANAI